MEVHHHPNLNHMPKPWKEYLLEGLMIFLAVTLGFFAESLREHFNDRSKEQEYLRSLVNELKYDTSQYKNILQKIIYLRPILDSMYLNIKKPQRFNYILQARWNTPVNETGVLYQPALTTIQQLESSGNLRLIENKDMAYEIMIYETYVKGNLQHNNLQTQVAADNIYSQEDAMCDEADFSDKLNENMLHNIPKEKSALYDMPLLVKDGVVLNKLANGFINYKGRLYAHSIAIHKSIELATNLIASINEKYNLK